MMKRLLLAAFAAACLSSPAWADAKVVSSCGGITYDTGASLPQMPLTQDATGKLCGSSSVAVTPAVATPTDKSGTLTAGGTSQTLAAANTSRKCLIVQNPISATEQGIATAEDLYLNNNAVAAVAGNGANWAVLGPGGSASFCFSGLVDQTAITVNATTINHRWYAREY
jgi:hypothetical protein